MTRLGVFLLALTLGVGATATASAAKKGGGGKGGGAAPPSEELNKLKAIKIGDPKGGVFSWGMSTTEVSDKVKVAVEQRYQEKIQAAKADPGKQYRIRDEQAKELDAIRKSFTKFEGQKTGWDVSIIGPEFAQNNGEAVLQTKDDVWTRYFFFFEDRLYKIFLAFNKEFIGQKSFQEFGKEMAARYGHPREVYRDEKVRGGMRRVLDHFEWAVSGGNALRLVDRSEFYGVYCLVLSDPSASRSVAEKRKITNPGREEKDALVEAVVNSKEPTSDSNDDVIDRITGRKAVKPGDEEKHGNVQVPMPKAPSPSEVNSGSGSGSSASSGSGSSGSGSSSPGMSSSAAKKEKAEKPKKSKDDDKRSNTAGLEL
jgi:hypothetical protein